MITGSMLALAFFMALFTGVCFVVLNLGLNIWGPLLYGIVAGILAGDINLGVLIGANCTLFALGFYTFGGTAVPDFSIGAVFGVFAAAQASTIQGIDMAMDQALLMASAIALFMMLFDILGRSVTTVFFHAADRALASRNLVSFQRWHLAGTIPLGLSRFIPVFVGMLFINQYQKLVVVVNSMGWLERGLSVVGAALPAIGFALLLTRMKLAAYWPYVLMGYLLFAYLNVPVTGLAIAGIACAGLYIRSKRGQLTAGGK